MIDLRAASLLDFLPESIADDLEIIALTHAVDPELQAVSLAIIEANILPRIASLTEPVLDAIAWGFRLNELTLWDDATLDGKRRLLVDVLDILKRSGTRFAVRRIFDLLQLTGTVIEWWEEAGTPHTYRLRVDASEIGISLHVINQIPELLRRFARASQHLSELAVEANAPVPLLPASALTTGRLVTIPFGGP